MNKAYNYALSLLAKREYSALELENKLQKKGFDSDIIALSLGKLKELNLQNDERYVEMICHARIRQGYGPLRIKQELSSKSIAGYIVDDILRLEQNNWVEYAYSVWRKKYKQQEQYSTQDIQKQKSFLYSRGYTIDTITQVFKEKLSDM